MNKHLHNSEEIVVDKPLLRISAKIGAHIIHETGKESLTVFNKISSDGQTSIIRCFPKTGRTHQIRVHLQYLGFPIVNDSSYNSYAFGPAKGKNGDYGVSDIAKV